VFQALNRRSGDVAGHVSICGGFYASGATGCNSGGYRMQIIVVFVLFALSLDALAVGICSIVERYSEHVSLLVFLAFFAGNFVVAWHLALYVVERYFVTDAQRKKDEEHQRWVRSLFVTARR
jgi:hypothetical protein